MYQLIRHRWKERKHTYVVVVLQQNICSSHPFTTLSPENPIQLKDQRRLALLQFVHTENEIERDKVKQKTVRESGGNARPIVCQPRCKDTHTTIQNPHLTRAHKRDAHTAAVCVPTMPNKLLFYFKAYFKLQSIH